LPTTKAGTSSTRLDLHHGLPARSAEVSCKGELPYADYLVWRGLSGAGDDVEPLLAALDEHPEVGITYRLFAGCPEPPDAHPFSYWAQSCWIAEVVVRRPLLQAVMYAGREANLRADHRAWIEAAQVANVLRVGGEIEQCGRAKPRVLRIVGDLTRQGTARQVLNLCRTVNAHTEVLSAQGGALEEPLREAGARVIVTGSIRTLRDVLPAAVARADVVHLHYWGNDFGVLKDLEATGKLVVTSHCYGIRYLGTEAWSVTPYATQTSGGGAPMEVEITSAVDWSAIDAARLPRDEARDEEGLPHDAPVFVTVTRAVAMKGWRVWLDTVGAIAKRLPGAQFISIGPASWHTDYEEYAAREAALQVQGVALRTLDDIPLERVIRLMCAADVFLHTSHSEATPIALREAARCGTPIVASDAGGTSQVVPEGTALIASTDPEAFAEAALEKIGTDSAGLPWARFSMQAQAARYEELYRLVMRDCKGGTEYVPSRREITAADKRWPKPEQRTLCIVVMHGNPSGGTNVVRRIGRHMQARGWFVEVLFAPGETQDDWSEFSCVRRGTAQGYYDAVLSTFVATRPIARQLNCGARFGLVQSDEPEWVVGRTNYKQWRAAFELDGFHDIIIADHMRGFAAKYGMNIVGQVSLGVDQHIFCPKADFPINRTPGKRILVVTKGVRVWYDGHDYLIPALHELAKRYPELIIDWLGYPPPAFDCRVDHHQTWNPHEVAGLYSQASVFVLPSLIEGSPCTVREAMACGTAVVTTPTGIDYGRDGENCLLIPHRDTRAIVAAVSRLFDDDREREQIALEGLRTMREHTWARFVGDVERIVERYAHQVPPLAE
jgi:glycosyltransferase involved in cell wall biosynthesis